MTAQRSMAPNADASGLDAAHFRQVLGSFATGVTIVTAVHDDQPVGLTCQSFVSQSMNPPLVAFSPSKESTSFPRIRATSAFCVNVLARDQHDLALTFARSGIDKWRDVGWEPGLTGSPVLDGVIASVDCVARVVYSVGDHFLCIGEVVEMRSDPSGDPLLYFRGALGAFTESES